MADGIISSFRDRFDELVKESGKTTGQVADDLGVSQQAVSAWRTGTRSPKRPTIIHIANHFNVNIPWIMGFDVQKRQKRILRAGIPEFEDVMQLHWSWIIIEAYKHKGKETQQAVCNVLGIEYVSSEMNDQEIMELENAINDFTAPEDPYAEDWE